MKPAFRSVAVAVLVALSLAPGCGRSGVERVPIRGRVTLDGAPLAYGSILFTPIGAARGPRAGGVIIAGVYAIEQAEGPLPGELSVEIHAPRLAPGVRLPETDSERFKMAAEAPELLPDRYHAASTLQVTATREGENRFDFELTGGAGR